MARTCPNCLATMRAKDVHCVELDICPTCGAVWFDSDELRALLAQDSKVFSEVERLSVPQAEQKIADSSKLFCPDDKTLLRQYHYMYNTPVMLETCDKCGGFLIQEGELDKMQQFLDQSQRPLTGQEQIAADMAQEVANHAREMERAETYANLFGMLRRTQPGWYGLF